MGEGWRDEVLAVLNGFKSLCCLVVSGQMEQGVRYSKAVAVGSSKGLDLR